MTKLKAKAKLLDAAGGSPMKHTLTITWHSGTILNTPEGDELSSGRRRSSSWYDYWNALIQASLILVGDLVDGAVTSVQVKQEND